MSADPYTDFQIGDRVRYVEGIRNGGLRRRQVGTITRIFTDGTSGPLWADVKFEDVVEPESVSRCLILHRRESSHEPRGSALSQNDIEVTALHHHMLNDEPRLFFMHFWANENVNVHEKSSSGH